MMMMMMMMIRIVWFVDIMADFAFGHPVDSNMTTVGDRWMSSARRLLVIFF
jgi:hypothetical protein